MSNSWQQESANNHRSENNPRRATGGLLSTYGQLPAQQLPQLPPAQQINQPPGLGPAGPVARRHSGLLSQHGEFQNQQLRIANGGQYPPVNKSVGLLNNTFQTIR